MHVELRLVTPGHAEALLKGNTNNRKKDEKKITRYAKSMANGDWNAAAGAPILLQSDGTLLNGQHRLEAVVRCGQAITLLIMEDVPAETFWLVDQGEGKRTLAQKLGMQGSKYSSAMAGALGSAVAIQNSLGGALDVRQNGSEDERRLFLQENPGLEEWVARCTLLQSSTKTPNMSPSTVAAWAVHAEKALRPEDRGLLDTFVYKLYTLDCEAATGIVSITRKAILNTPSTGYADRGKKFALLTLGWRLFASGQERLVLNPRGVLMEFPKKVTR